MSSAEIRLISGKLFNLLRPDPALITPEVIAAALSKQCRFAGHTKRPYSVAEHCVRGSYLCGAPLDFLLHDASEAFVVDVPTPLKRLLDGYREIEEAIQRVIEQKFGVSIVDNLAVHHIDRVMLATEQRDLIVDATWEATPDPSIQNLAAQSGNAYTWEINYLERFKELTK